MNTTTRALACVLVAAAVAPAAEPVPGKPLDTTFLKQYAETRGFMLGRPQKPKIAPDGKTVLFLRADPKAPKMKLFEFDVASGKTKELLSPAMLLQGAEENLSPEEKARRERQRVSVGGFTDFHLDKEGKNVLVALSGKLYVFDRATAKATELKTGEGGAIVDPKWSPDGKQIAYVRGYDVYVYDLAAGKESAVTTGGTATKTHGLAEFVAQEEMGRHSGYWWSPDGKHIAYEEADHAGVETWYVADPLKPDAKPAEQFYPRPGKKNVAVRLGVIPVTGGETVWVEWDRKTYEYLGRVVWGRETIMLTVQNRQQNRLAYLGYDPRTGKSRDMSGDRPDDANFSALVGKGGIHLNCGEEGWLALPPEPFWNEERDEFFCPVAKRHASYGGPEDSLYLMDWLGFKDGKTCVTTGVEADEIVSFSDAKQRIIQIRRPNPTEAHLYALNLNGDKRVRAAGGIPLTDGHGVHTAVFSKDQAFGVVTSTTIDAMPAAHILEIDANEQGNRNRGTLPSVAIEPPFTPNVKVEKVGDYWTAIVRPRDFDPKKKYPVIVDVYGGPKHLHVVQAMRNWLVPQWLADQGFVVVAIDNRGTPGRGREWERSVYQKFGTVPVEDQAKGVAALCAKFPELDRDRVGIVGWSFGGYNAANGVLRKPEVFKAAVAGAPVTDWEDYDTHYTERYMGLLPESKAAYEDASLIPLAKNLKRPLMLVHGTADDNVYYRHSLKLADALFRAGKDFDAVALPGVTHMYSADPTVMERLWAKTATFFKQHLGEPK
ncbi:MAG TPA: alpha/beta fold hydrolase [Gemmata sp.]|nr:alpha/beta fold hydrolase [Gemmata sp.]